MPDETDELILRMQHLEAQARAQRDARAAHAGADRVKSAAERLALESRKELEEAQAAERAADAKSERARAPGVPPLEAADLLSAARSEAQAARARAVRARTKLDFALDRMDQVERREWEALQAEARAEAHAQLADDPLFKKP